MAKYTNLIPQFNQANVPKTSGVSFTILTDGYNGAQIGTLSAKIEGTFAIQNGSFVNDYSGTIFSGTGKYVIGIRPRSPSFLSSAAAIQVQLEVLDDYGSIDAYNYSFYTSGYGTTQSTETSVVLRDCPIKPFWPPTGLGLRLASDKGTGTEVNLEWVAGHPNNENNIVFYNIYYSTQRIEVFENPPIFIVSDTSAMIGGLCPGDTNFFGVRVSEFDPDLTTLEGLRQVGSNMYSYPTTTLDAYLDAYSLSVSANTNNFPEYGTLHIDTELITYTSKTASSFIVSKRGYAGSLGETHNAGATIRLYKGQEDGNTVIVQSTPTFQRQTNPVTWVKSDGYGFDGYRDGYDGYDKVFNNGPGAYRLFDGYDGYFRYRQEQFDNITTDGTNNDNSGGFPRFDYCGTYRRLSPASFMQGQCTGSYWGGVQLRDGYRVRVPDIRVHELQREELLLESTGEPMILLRRMWTGLRCPCISNRREHPTARCPICHGVGFVQGYNQFFNPRRPDSRILVRVDPADDDVNIIDKGGLEPLYEPNCWTLPFPAVRDRDVLVRFNPNGTQEYRYEILRVNRVRSFFEQTGVQKFVMKRFPKTDQIYQVALTWNTSPNPITITTSSNIAPGLPSHSHEIIIGATDDITKIRTSTTEVQGHTHTVLKGVVMPSAGHTHTLP